MIPKGSGDYTRTLQLGEQFKAKKIDFDAFQSGIMALDLKEPTEGLATLLMPIPSPPPGIEVDPKMMPNEWEGTWGEVAMLYWLDYIDRRQYDELTAAAFSK